MGYRGARIGAAYIRGINGKEKGRRAVTRRPRYCEKVDMNISRKPSAHISVPVDISIDPRVTDLQVRVYLRVMHHATTVAPDPELLAELIDSELGCGRHVALSAICALVATGWIGGDR